MLRAATAVNANAAIAAKRFETKKPFTCTLWHNREGSIDEELKAHGSISHFDLFLDRPLKKGQISFGLTSFSSKALNAIEKVSAVLRTYLKSMWTLAEENIDVET